MIHLTKFSPTTMVTLSQLSPLLSLCLLSCFVIILCIREGSELTRKHLELSSRRWPLSQTLLCGYGNVPFPLQSIQLVQLQRTIFQLLNFHSQGRGYTKGQNTQVFSLLNIFASIILSDYPSVSAAKLLNLGSDRFKQKSTSFGLRRSELNSDWSNISFVFLVMLCSP